MNYRNHVTQARLQHRSGQKIRTAVALFIVIILVFCLVLPASADTMVEYLNTDLPGSDYTRVAAETKDACSFLCLMDTRCRAATWVSVEFQNPSCWLKNSVPAKVPYPGGSTVMHSYIKACDPPIADFTASKTSGFASPTAPMSVTFTDSSTNAVSWLWEFGDQKTSTLQNPTHDYYEGVYTVSLTVANTCGQTDQETKTGYIKVTETTPIATPGFLGLVAVIALVSVLIVFLWRKS